MNITFPLAQQIALGAAWGVADFLLSTTYQKTCMLAGVKFEEDMDPGDIPPSERLDKMFWEMVVAYPVGEELVCGGLQILLTKGLLFYRSDLADSSVFGISHASLLSSVTVGSAFGAAHYLNYRKGGVAVAILGSISGSLFGIARARFGLTTSISAHSAHNFCMGWLDKHYPAFLG